MITKAADIARRSTMRSHKTGALIMRDTTIISNGWSHTPHYQLSNHQRSIHAEIHALARGRHLHLSGTTIYVATVSGKSGNFVSAKPCLDCAIALRTAGVFRVIYSTHGGQEEMWLPGDSDFADLKVYRNGSK
jgi:deoxycytidylate deaminase